MKNEIKEILILDQSKQVECSQLFTPLGMELMIKDIRAQAKNFIADITTKKGQAEIKSFAYKVSLSKGVIIGIADELKADHQAIVKSINNQLNVAKADLDELRDEIRKPVDEMEEKAAAIVRKCEDRLAEIEFLDDPRGALSPANYGTSQYWEDSLVELDHLQDFEWGIFAHKAATICKETREILESRFEAAKKSEADAIELAQLKAEKAARDKKDHEEKIAREAAETARKESEAKALEERNRVAEEQKKKDEEAQRKIDQDESLARKTKQDLLVYKRKNEMFTLGMTLEIFDSLNVDFREKITAALNDSDEKNNQWDDLLKESVIEIKKVLDSRNKKIEDDKNKAFLDARQKEIEAQQRAAIARNDAVIAERKRVLIQKAADDKAEKERQENQQHRANIKRQSMEDLICQVMNDKGVTLLSEDQARAVVVAISRGLIEHVSINY